VTLAPEPHLGKEAPSARILFIKFSAIGDIVAATPALRALKEKLRCHITLLTVKDYEGLLADCPYVDEIVAMERPFERLRFGFQWSDAWRLLSFLNELRGKHFTAVVNYQQNARSFVVELFLQPSVGAKIRALRNLIIESLMPAVLKRLRQRRLFTVIASGKVAFRPALYYDASPLRRFGIREVDPRPEFFLNDALRSFADETLSKRGIGPSSDALLVGINPGVNWESKRYFEDRYAAVADALIERHDAWILIFGGPADIQKAEAVLAGMRHKDRAVLVAGITPTPNHAAALIARCRLFITNDTGLMHIAAALGVPTVSLFGGTHPALHAPRAQPDCPHIHLSAGDSLRCWPCYRYHCHWKTERACFLGITTERVLSAAEMILTRRSHL
jgi:heptosyltransferase-2